MVVVGRLGEYDGVSGVLLGGTGDRFSGDTEDLLALGLGELTLMRDAVVSTRALC